MIGLRAAVSIDSDSDPDSGSLNICISSIVIMSQNAPKRHKFRQEVNQSIKYILCVIINHAFSTLSPLVS
jgi:hypothetical protein